MNQIFVHDCSGYKNSELFRVLGITVWTVGHTGDSGYEGLPAVGPGHPYGICPIPGVWCHGLWLVLEVVLCCGGVCICCMFWSGGCISAEVDLLFRLLVVVELSHYWGTDYSSA